MTAPAAVSPFDRPDIDAVIDAFWVHAASPGATLTGRDRVSVLATARDAWGDQTAADDDGHDVAAVARRVGGAPASIEQGWVDAVGSSIGFPTYIETVALASMLTAVDTLHRSLDLPLPVLPAPVAGEPTGAVNPSATVRAAWVPIEGPAAVTQCLNLVPAENDMRVEMSAPLYILDHLVVEPDCEHELSRPQIELIAARTSSINDCYF